MKNSYITVSLPEATATVFKKFAEARNITTKEAFGEALDAFMIATDEKLYNSLRNDYLGITKMRNIIAERKATEPEESLMFRFGKKYETFDGQVFLPEEVVDAYKRNMIENGGITWFSISSLPTGFNAERYQHLLDLIASEKPFYIYLVLEGRIAYRAKIKDIRNYDEPTPAPCTEKEYPHEFWGERQTIWLLLEELEEFDKYTTSDFRVMSSGNLLANALKGSKCLMFIERLKLSTTQSASDVFVGNLKN